MKNTNYFKSFVLIPLALMLVATVAGAAEYTVDKNHTTVDFTIRHFVTKVRGAFRDFEGVFSFDEKHPETSKVDFTIQAASIDTGNEKRDAHLKGPDFFDVEKHKTLTFKSTKFTAARNKKYKLEGDFTMHGVTKPVVFDVEYGGSVKDPQGATRAGFSAAAKINRKDFGMVWNKTMDAGGIMLGDDVNVELQIEAIEKSAKK